MDRIDLVAKYFDAVNYLSACQLYLLDNPLLENPLKKNIMMLTIMVVELIAARASFPTKLPTTMESTVL